MFIVLYSNKACQGCQLFERTFLRVMAEMQSNEYIFEIVDADSDIDSMVSKLPLIKIKDKDYHTIRQATGNMSEEKFKALIKGEAYD